MAKQSQKRTKRAAFRDGVGVEDAGEHHRLVGDEADRRPSIASEAGDDVPGESPADLEEVAVVGDFEDQLLDVVGLVRGVRNEPIERRLGAVGRIGGGDLGHRRTVAERQEIDQPAHFEERLGVVVIGAVGDRRAGGVDPLRRRAPPASPSRW